MPTLSMSLSGVKRTSLIGWPMSANDPQRTFSAVPLDNQCLAVSSRQARPETVEDSPDTRSGVCHTTIELGVLYQVRAD
jgi:hypothetical protein